MHFDAKKTHAKTHDHCEFAGTHVMREATLRASKGRQGIFVPKPGILRS